MFLYFVHFVSQIALVRHILFFCLFVSVFLFQFFLGCVCVCVLFICLNLLFEKGCGQVVMVPVFNPSIWQAEAGESLEF